MYIVYEDNCTHIIQHETKIFTNVQNFTAQKYLNLQHHITFKINLWYKGKLPHP